MADKWTKPTDADATEMRSALVDERNRLKRIADERRHAQRVELRAKVTLSSESNFFTGWSQNISEGGVFISCLAPPTVGTIVVVNLDSEESGEPIQISCEVVWIRTENGQPVGCGCRFESINDIQAALIRRLMDEANREPLFYDV
jgi:uncharacterized protein (TIGR02266 family)